MKGRQKFNSLQDSTSKELFRNTENLQIKNPTIKDWF